MYEVSPDILDICKALGENTRFAIFRQIAGATTPLTVKHLVATFGMHHSAIRIHLTRLEEAGLIVSQKQHSRGAVGRPQLAFLPNPNALAITFPPRNYELLARITIDFASRGKSERAAALDFATSWGRKFVNGRQNGDYDPSSAPAALAVLADELRALGIELETMQGDEEGSFLLINRNCPFSELASEHEPFACQLHQSMMRGMLVVLYSGEIEWNHESSMARGDDRCLTKVRLVERKTVAH